MNELAQKNIFADLENWKIDIFRTNSLQIDFFEIKFFFEVFLILARIETQIQSIWASAKW